MNKGGKQNVFTVWFPNRFMVVGLSTYRTHLVCGHGNSWVKILCQGCVLPWRKEGQT